VWRVPSWILGVGSSSIVGSYKTIANSPAGSCNALGTKFTGRNIPKEGALPTLLSIVETPSSPSFAGTTNVFRKTSPLSRRRDFNALISRPPKTTLWTPNVESLEEEESGVGWSSSAYEVVLRFLRAGRTEVRFERGGWKGLERVEEMVGELA
jgi:hypothetical protein